MNGLSPRVDHPAFTLIFVREFDKPDLIWIFWRRLRGTAKDLEQKSLISVVGMIHQ